ncbi:metallophosphoesterase family protein [Streptoalloteichus tenebrarius]|uniref:metallophosphoesterase family protein n=1 Tax=Streptoalloteichus tenebrarius (strain ATCC 17920 / DSM 40477 / JCM 4838 / CBS 697.72 / NBRC 16177 / NCIMB 11028 / NRRL B-12390 / A12253. 1 / ISP 5477) TaxID=1933 RepID=UPI0020A43A31|nr:metallophosphoesterase [Streptoalloteichus tenebrarius]
MPRVLAVADEVVEGLWTERVRRLGVDLVLAAGDLPFEYLEYLATTVDRPCVFVPGNHDPDLSGYREARGLWTRAGMPARWPGPAGAVNADGRVVDVAGLRIAGLGGSLRYGGGPNQWTERQQARRVRRLVGLAAWRRMRDGRDVDVLLTHSPPRGCGDGEDAPHRGFECLHEAVRRLRPRVLVHGHVHPHGHPAPDRAARGTLVLNVVGHRVLEIAPAEEVRDAP